MEKTKYRLWLKLRIGKSLDTEDDALTVSIAGRTVTIESENRGEPLSKTSWLVMSCRGFETEAQAREFGEELRRATHLAGLCNRLGVDAGDPGEDRTMFWLNPEIVRNVNPDIRLAPDVHGIVILPDDGNNVFARWPMTAQVRANTGHFARSLEECLPGNDPLRSGSPSIRRAIRMLSLAEINEDPIAKLVLAVSTIEGLAKDPQLIEKRGRVAGTSPSSVCRLISKPIPYSPPCLRGNWMLPRRDRLRITSLILPWERVGKPRSPISTTPRRR